MDTNTQRSYTSLIAALNLPLVHTLAQMGIVLSMMYRHDLSSDCCLYCNEGSAVQPGSRIGGGKRHFRKKEDHARCSTRFRV